MGENDSSADDDTSEEMQTEMIYTGNNMRRKLSVLLNVELTDRAIEQKVKRQESVNEYIYMFVFFPNMKTC